MRSHHRLRFFILPSTSLLVLTCVMAGCAPARSDGVAASGGNANAGGQAGGTNITGGANAPGGATAAGGTTATSGSESSGGSPGRGGANSSGGALSSGGQAGSSGAAGSSAPIGAGGTVGAGGVATAGGSPANGGSARSGGSTGAGGAAGSGGATGAGGAAGSSGSVGTRPCDIYQAAGFPCVAAHSTVRALYGSYTGPLYQVRKGSNTKDIPVGADGYVNIAEQDAFCTGGGCTISLLYDQSPNKNHLPKTPDTLWLKNSKEANATDGKITINGHTAYGIYVNNPSANVGYRNNACKGVAKNDEPEAMYMVLDGKRYTQWCCFDYGNVSSTGLADGPGTMEAIYWGSSTQFNKGGSGSGPWVEADLEYGMFACDTPTASCTTNTPVTGWSYVTAMLKGPSGNAFALKAGNAQSGTLQTKWDGKRPPGGYAPKKLGGQILLGTGGDGSNNGIGTFWEGAMTQGNPPSSVDDDVQANIVAAGYGK